MILKKTTLILAAMLAGQSPAHAFDCDRQGFAAANAFAEELAAAGIVQPLAARNGRVRAGVNQQQWDLMNLQRREAVVTAVECAIAGSGNSLTAMDVVSLSTGELLANVINGTIYVPAKR